MKDDSENIIARFSRVFREHREEALQEKVKEARVRFPNLSNDELRAQVEKEEDEANDRLQEKIRIEEQQRTEAFGEYLEKYVEDLAILFRGGFNPVKVTTMTLEYTFVFKTQEEADAAYERFEENRIKEEDPQPVIGWWYGEENFAKAKDEYEADMSKLYDEPYRIRVIDIDHETKQRILDFRYANA